MQEFTQGRDEMCRRLARWLADEFGHDHEALRRWLLLAEARANADRAASARILETHLDADAAAKAASAAVDALAEAVGRLPAKTTGAAPAPARNGTERVLYAPGAGAAP